MKKLFTILGLIAGALAGFVAAILIINFVSTLSTEEPEEEAAEEVIEATEVKSHEIDLDDYNTNIALVEAGDYYLSGNFSHIIKIDVPTGQYDENKPRVTLFLNGINIDSETVAIKNTSYNDLIFYTSPGTINTITSTNDTVIDTAGHLAINGRGALTVWNKQTEGRGVGISANNLGFYGGENILIGGTTDTGAGVSTKDRFWINGGDVTILGTDMLESPVSNDLTIPDTRPRSASFSLTEIYPADSVIRVLNSRGVRVANYVAPVSFCTVIVSNSLITPGEYTIYINNTKVKTVEV